MNTRQLHYVIAVAEEQSISRAAEKLHISQPSLSQYIRNLEKSLEVELFDRTVTPLALTEMGREYVRTAREIVALENELNKRISDYRADNVQSLNIGVSAYLNSGELSATLAEMRRYYPNVSIYAQEMFSRHMDELIERGELDFSISPINSSYDMTRFCRDVVSRDSFFLTASRELLERCCPRLRQAEDGDVVDLRELAELPFITMAELSLQTYSTYMAAQEAGIQLKIVMRCRRWDMLAELVEGGAGAAFITDRFLLDRAISENVVLLRTVPEAPELVGAVSYRRGVYLPKAARTFISTYKRIVAQNRDETAHLKKRIVS